MRGGGPIMAVLDEIGAKSSPHARGWSPPSRSRRNQQTVFPACAGVVPLARRVTLALRGLPRMRGGGPRQSTGPQTGPKSSPHARGWSHSGPLVDRCLAVFPACAGVVPVVEVRRNVARCLPRMRGGGPGWQKPVSLDTPSSPHARGWSQHLTQTVDGGLVFPACAGVVPG